MSESKYNYPVQSGTVKINRATHSEMDGVVIGYDEDGETLRVRLDVYGTEVRIRPDQIITATRKTTSSSSSTTNTSSSSSLSESSSSSSWSESSSTTSSSSSTEIP